jgi:hypothetical protein
MPSPTGEPLIAATTDPTGDDAVAIFEFLLDFIAQVRLAATPAHQARALVRCARHASSDSLFRRKTTRLTSGSIW